MNLQTLPKDVFLLRLQGLSLEAIAGKLEADPVMVRKILFKLGLAGWNLTGYPDLAIKAAAGYKSLRLWCRANQMKEFKWAQLQDRVGYPGTIKRFIHAAGDAWKDNGGITVPEIELIEPSGTVRISIPNPAGGWLNYLYKPEELFG